MSAGSLLLLHDKRGGGGNSYRQCGSLAARGCGNSHFVSFCESQTICARCWHALGTTKPYACTQLDPAASLAQWAINCPNNPLTGKQQCSNDMAALSMTGTLGMQIFSQYREHGVLLHRGFSMQDFAHQV